MNLHIKPIFSALFLMLSLVTFSCKESEETEIPHPLNEATITILSPTEHEIVTAADSVHITGNITGKQTIHGYHLTIRKKSDNTELFTKKIHVHSTQIEINQKWAIDKNLIASDMLELEVTAILDHDNHTANKKVSFHCHH